MPTEIAAHWSVSGCAPSVPAGDEPRARVVQRDVAAADRRGARAAVGLEHVAVDGDLHLAHRREVGDRAQRPADQALDLLRAARTACPAPPRGRCARASSRAASSTRRSPSPGPVPRSHGGTRSSTDAVHSTRVRPNSTSTEPVGELGEVAHEQRPGAARRAHARRVRMPHSGCSGSAESRRCDEMRRRQR